MNIEHADIEYPSLEMIRRPIYPLKVKSIFISFGLIFALAVSAKAQNCCDVDGNVDLCYLSGATYCGSNTGSCFEYSLDGNFMVNALTAKLNSANNFGPDGTVDCSLELKILEDISSVDAINACGCDIIFLPNVFIEPGTNTMDLSQSYIPEDILQNIYDWSLACDNNLVIATQGEANLWGYTTTNSNVNPNTPVAGTSLNSIFEGPFGSLDQFNQGGSFQGVFTETPSTGFEVLSHDANGNPTAALDLVSNDIVIGDIGVFCSGGAGVVSTGAGVNNNNDILICNIFALACQLAEEGNKVTVTHELCPGESVFLPNGQEVNTAGIYIDTLMAFNGCDSIITTSLAYGIDESPIFMEPDTTICQGDTIAIDGSLPIFFPIPFFENPNDLPIDPIFVNVVSEIPVTGFGSILLGPGMIQSICFDIEHTWLDDLDILLIAPNGEYVELTTDNGLTDNNYTGTCFTETASTVIGSAGTAAPFTGDFLPEGDWSDIYGSPVNGTWQLVLKDDTNGFQGTLLNWNITFFPVLDLSYHWETNTGLSCDDCPVTEAFPEQTTTYYLTMTDAYGCSTLDSTLIEVIPSLPAPVVVCDSITLTSINVSWNEVPGATDYQININGNGWISPNDGTLAHFLSGLSPLDTVEILVQALDECNGNISALTCSTPDCNAPFPALETISPTTCFGYGDGELSISATGGSGMGYSYELNGEINTTGVFTNLEAGQYDVIVVDSDNCDITYPVEIQQPDSITLTPVYEQEISCFGAGDGSITVEVGGGFAPYSFEWNSTPGDSILTNVSPGNYEVLVSNVNGCTNTNTLVVSEPPLLSVQTDSTLVDCFENNTGTATVLPEGGTIPYSIQWDNAADNQTSETAVSLTAGNYSVTVFDGNSCETTSIIQVNQPEELSAVMDFEDPKCFEAEDGMIEISPAGGTPNYTYSWNNGLPGAASFTNLPAGDYAVTILDANDCSIELSTNLINPDPIEITSQKEDVSCFNGTNGSITIASTGVTGSPVFTWDNGSSSQNLDNLPIGNYCITITDGNNCEAQECVSIEQPPLLSVSLNPQNISCDETDDGAIDLTVSGGVFPYNIDWSTGSDNEDLTDLVVGDYMVTVTDANNCESMGSIILVENVPLFSLAFDPIEVDCFGASTGGVNLSVNGVSGNFNYQWLGPDNYQSATEDLDNIPIGNYEVAVTDQFGCEVSGEITIQQPTPVSTNFDVQDVSCFGLEDGNITVLTEGGTFPYLFSLDQGQSFISSAIFNNLEGGTYDVITQDANGCESTSIVSVIEPEEVILEVEPIVEIILGETYTYHNSLNIPENEIDTIIWTPTDSLNCPTCLTTTANPEYTTNYTVQVVTKDGCIAQAFTNLFVDRRISVFVPSGFSPNGDGINDALMIFAAETNINQIKTFQIFDRWGAHVFGATNFQPNDPQISWDGTLSGKNLNPGVFTWFAEIELSDGYIELFKGSVTLVR
jgi:gliding motility-associated-like protein